MFTTTAEIIHAITGKRIATVSGSRDTIRNDLERIIGDWFGVPPGEVEFAETEDGSEIAMFGPVTLAFLRSPAPVTVPAEEPWWLKQVGEVPALIALTLFVAMLFVAAATIASRGMV